MTASAYEFLALSADGAEQRGDFVAPDVEAVVVSLRNRGLLVLWVRPCSGARRARGTYLGRVGPRSLRSRQREAFLRQLAVLLRSGLTLVRALETARLGTAPRVTRELAGRLEERVRAGASFSAALGLERGLLAQDALQRIEGAEAVGELDRALEDAAVDEERRRRTKERLRAALAYPSIVFVVSIVVAALLVLKVVPRFAQFFASSGRPLPSNLAKLVDVSELAAVWTPPLALVLLVLSVGCLVARRRRGPRKVLDAAFLRLPVVGWLLAQRALWNATYALARLVDAGVPILHSLRLAGNGAGNLVFEDAFHEAAERVLEGTELATALEHPRVPLDLRQVVAVGERSGELGRVLEHMAQHYEREVEEAMRRLAALAEPVLLLVVGGMVGFIYLSFFQAIFQIAGG